MVRVVEQLTALLLVTHAFTAAAGASTRRRPSPRTLRALEEQGYQYMEDLTTYQMQFGKCVRVKVPENNDDDGNSYFYNGKFYSQGQQFASVFLCENDGSSSEEDQCGTCDRSKEYVTDLATYLETTLEYAQAMCNSCEAQCYRRRRTTETSTAVRNLEEEEEANNNQEAMMRVNCNTCVNICKNMNFNYANDEDNNNEDGEEGENANYNNYVADETQYLECQEAFQDDSGTQIYAGPQCNSDGDIIIGFYYDEDCTVKSSSASLDLGLEYGTFRGLQTMCLDCNPYGNGEDDVCQEIYQDSTHCGNGKNLANDGGDEDMPICKTVAKASRERFYGKHPKKWRIVEWTIAIALIVFLSCGFLTLSYTYFLRHRRSSSSSKKEPLVDQDHHTEPEVTISSKNDLPSVS